MSRGKRPPRGTRAAAAAAEAINNVLLGALAAPVISAAVAGPSGVRSSFSPSHRRNQLGRPRPNAGVEVKRMQVFRRRKKDIKIKKLLLQPRTINVKKNGVVVRKMTVRRRSYFSGRGAGVY